MKFDISVFCKKSVEKIQISLKSRKHSGNCAWTAVRIYGNIAMNYA